MTVLVGIVEPGLHHLLQPVHAVGDVAEVDLGNAQHALGEDEVVVVLQGFARLLAGGPRVTQQVLQRQCLGGAREVAAGIEHDGAVRRGQDLVTRGLGHRRGVVVGDAEQAEAQHGLGHRAVGRALDREPQRRDRLAVPVERVKEAAGRLVEQLRHGERRIVDVAQALEQLRLDPDADGRGDMQDDVVLQLEDVVELAIIALGPDLRGRSTLPQAERQAQPPARRLHRPLEDEVAAGRIARDHRERGLAGERIADRVRQGLGHSLDLVVAADGADRADRDHRLWRNGRGARRGCGRRCAAGRSDMIDGDRVVDVLELLRAAIDEAEVRQLAADLVEHLGRDADRTRPGDRLETGRDVDAVAVQIVAFDDDVADVDADAELQRLHLRPRIARPDGLLALGGAEHRRDRAGELGDD